MNNRSHFSFLLVLTLFCLRAEASFNEVGSGTMLLDFKSTGNTQWVAPGLETDVDITVTGPIVRTTVTQTFNNPGSEWANATYVFPLSETAAVDQMKLIVGERVIEGQIKEKLEAKQIYETAKKQGKKASLVSQQRSNMFTTHVANIPPGETIKVSIQYQHPVDKTNDTYSLRFPMTITPRYIPGHPITDAEIEETTTSAWSANTAAVPDAAEITPPWGMQGDNHNPTSIRVNLHPGFELAATDSLYHRVLKKRLSDSSTVLTLAAQDHPANSDFVIQWQPKLSKVPQVAAFSEFAGGQQYSLLMLTPPAPELAGEPPAREIIYVIDTSGSMGGEPIRQAKQALIWALDRLRPTDSFNVIEFNSGSWTLFSSAQQATDNAIGRAKLFVSQLEARGGTEMMGAMEKALCDLCDAKEKLRQVIFLTDGAIGNEDQLFNLINTKLAHSRLFTVGIGSAPNSFFMRKAAETGRGTYTYIAKAEESGEKMAQLFATLEAPMLTDIQIDAGSSSIELTPNPVPDIYSGKPIVLMINGKLPQQLTISGRQGHKRWQQTLSKSFFVTGSGIQVLWGRQKIEELMDLYRFTYNPQEKETLKTAITDTALKHHLVSAFTSLVAVDITPAKNTADPSLDHNIANNSPHGTQFGLATTATPAMEKLLIGILLTILALLLIWWQIRSDRRSEAAQDATIRALRCDAQ